MILSTFIFYIFSASAILFYGIGIKDLLLVIDNPKKVSFFVLKTLLTSIFTVLVTWFISTHVLVPVSLADIYPFFLIFICLTFSILFTFLFKLLLKIEIKEFTISFFISFIAINEGVNLVFALLITISSVLSFYLLIPLFYSIKKRINNSMANVNFKSGVLILLSIAIILLLVFTYNISWFNFEVV